MIISPRFYYLLVCICTCVCSCSSDNSIEWTETSELDQWKRNAGNGKISGTVSDTVIISSIDAKQQIDGFGGCFNELGWEALQMLTETERDQVLNSLFDSVAGCHFSICRMPIGANDYALDWYSHNETPEDFQMNSFSIERDKKRLLPYIKAAKQKTPDLKIWASPWCPPSWMKTNKHYACYPAKSNGLAKDLQGEEMHDQFITDSLHFASYALYFSKFIRAYRNEGVDIYAVHTQNEPNSCQNFPSCIWTPTAMKTFIGDYLGPRFKMDSLNTEIWLGTIERPQPERVDTILKEIKASQYLTGVGFQWAGKDAIPYVHKEYPSLRLMQTETECGDGSNDWKAAMHTFELMKHYLDNGANSYMYWNMVLNETGKSQWGWRQNSMITIDTQAKLVRYNPEYYLMKHLSYYLKPGAVVLGVKGNSEDCLAFKDEDTIVIVYFNKQASARNVMFTVDDKKHVLSLKPTSINTLRIKANRMEE